MTAFQFYFRNADMLAQQGIYLSCGDFIAGKLSHSEKKTVIRPLGIFRKNIIRVKSNDTLYTYKANTIFGYRDKTDNSYRFFENEALLILNPGEDLLLYQFKTGNGLKNSPETLIYFFSRGACGSIQPLNFKNILNAYYDNESFVTALEIYYRTAGDLIRQDENTGLYKLNTLLKLTDEKQFNHETKNDEQ